MGKAGIYVFLIVLAALFLAAFVYLTVQVYRDMKRRSCIGELDKLNTAARWEHYTDIGEDGGLTIGVRRAAIDKHDRRHVFQGPIEMYALAASHDAVDVQVKIGEARDRASLYNDSITSS